MEEPKPKHSSREKKRNDNEKSPKKDKQAKSRKKASKTNSHQQSQTKTPSEVNLQNEAESREGGLPSERVNASGASRDTVGDADGAVVGDASQKRDRSKSRSRSGSRSRFSGFFRRKRYSVSETDLNRGSRGENERMCDSSENFTPGNRPRSLQFREGVDDEGSTGHLKSSLKTCPPHRVYDPRVQPRDRLLHMTVADAVKEQQLRRGNSAQRSPHAPDTATPTTHVRYMSSPSLAATLSALDAGRQSDLDATPSSILTPLKRKQNSDEVLRPSFKYILPSPVPQDLRGRSAATPTEILNQASRVDQSSLRQNSLHKDSSQSIDITNTTADTSERQPTERNATEQQQAIHKKTDLPKPIVSQAHQTVNPHKTRQHSPSPTQHTPMEESKDAKIKQKASLSKFLELRQTLPSSISRTHRLSQSSDSGVTSRDPSPSAHADRPKPQLDKAPRPLEAPPAFEKSTNPYVVSSVSISPSLITAPKVSITGSQLESTLDHASVPKPRPTSIKLEDSTGAESSSVSSSPQINSMTSSFRSSDQGYANSDSDEDNASFSTPPEEVSPGKRERAARTFNPGVLEQLLATTRDKSQPELFPELDLDNWDTKQGRRFTRADEVLVEPNLPKENFIKKEKAQSAEPRYIPRGVRRSKSDVDSRRKPLGVLRRQALEDDDQRPRTASADTFQLSPNLNREKVKFDLDRLSAASTSTLVVQDENGAITNGEHVVLERNDQKLVPVMGTIAQQRYRRTYSPSKVRKPDPPSKDETTSSSDDIISPKKIYPQERLPAPSQPSNQSTPIKNLPEKSELSPSSRSEQSPTFPRKGILKSPVRDRSISLTETSSETAPKSGPKIELKSASGISTNISPKADITTEASSKTNSITRKSSKTEKSNKIRRKSETSGGKTSKTEVTPSTSQKTNNSIETPLTSETGGGHTSQKLENSSEISPKPEIHISTPQKPENSNEITSKTDISQQLPPTSPIPISINIYDVDTSPTSTSPTSTPPTSTSPTSTSPTSTSPVPKPTVSTDNCTESTSTLPESTSDISKRKTVNLSMDFPLIHGLEIGMHKVHSFSGYSLADYLKGHSKVNRKNEPAGRVTKSKEKNSSKLSNKKKVSSNTEIEKQSNELKLDRKDMSEAKCSQEYTSKERENNKFTIMVDKECQTSAWLVNALVRKKTAKPKKKVHSFSRKKKPERRGSTVSDTFIPTDTQKSKDSHHRSSLGDIRLACAAMASFTKDGARASSLSRGASEKSIGKSVKTKREIITRHEPILPGSSLRSSALGSSVEASLPKPKKLSLAAVILLKNRLAKYREKKRPEQNSIDETQDDETSVNSVGSDTLITIENELNLSKLEVSKETDIVDDDIYEYEPEFSLGYTRKQLRFESLPSTEAIQSEEPLPPLPLLTSRRMRQRRESTLRERRRKCVQYCKKFIAFLFSHIGLCSLVVAYTILGGFIFQHLEGQAEYTVRSTIRDKREKVVDKMVALFFEFPRDEEGRNNFTRETNSTMQDYQVFIHGITKDKGWDGVEGVDETGLWTFASSLLYAITVTTTIGYGHVAPKTPEGRIVTIGYAVVGIPLTLLCLTNIGDVMATGFRLLYGKICCGICCTLFKPRRRRIQVDLEKGLGGSMIAANEEQPDKPKEVIHVPTSLCLLLIAGYIFAGAMLFSMWENWDILTGSYFCFITLSTIGFGDIVPGMDSNAWAGEEKLVLCALYLVLGLSLIAMCFNLVQEDVKAKCRWLGMKLGIVDKHETPI